MKLSYCCEYQILITLQMFLSSCTWLWHLARLAMVKSEDCLLAAKFIYPPSPSQHHTENKRGTIWKQLTCGGRCSLAPGIWISPWAGAWRVDLTHAIIFWHLLQFLAVAQDSFDCTETGVVNIYMPNAHPRKNDLMPLMPFLLFSFPLSLLLFTKLMLIIITCRQAPTSIFKQIKDEAGGKQEQGEFCLIRIQLLSAFDFQLFVWLWIFKKYGIKDSRKNYTYASVWDVIRKRVFHFLNMLIEITKYVSSGREFRGPMKGSLCLCVSVLIVHL